MIAREGLVLILIAVSLTAVLLWSAVRWDNLALAILAGILSILTVFTIFFFRDPDRSFEHRPGILVSPADGEVLAVEHLDFHDYIDGPALQISIFLSVLDVHINRVPTDGIIDCVDYFPGQFNMAFRDKASTLNERTEIGMISPDGHRVFFKQIAGILARRIVCKLKPGDSVTAGERFGMIRFGSRTELFVPAASDIQVKPGDHVTGSKTIIGYLPQEADADWTADSTRGESRVDQ
ncbi:MAG TPA: phosphatidylserine decarboxylase family protein [candidate division Zixibacteria bacterium]|nr:phosphatidylserine decarboxylase family protein [candidate division Zixibacteria bacterium]